VAYAYEGIAQLFDKKNQLDSAIFYCSQALNIFKELEVKFDIVYESTLLADYYNRSGKVKDAEKLLLQTLSITYSENLPHDRHNVLSFLAGIAEQKGDFKNAFHYLNAATALKDSLKLDEQKTELTELAGKYETEKRDKQIAIEQAENQKQKVENEKQKQLKYFFLSGAALLALLVLVLISRYRQKQKATKLLEEKNVQIEKEKQRAEHSEQMKQQFLANMSHEIRTPMNAITGLSRLLLDKAHDEKSTEYIKAIHHSGENLNVILNDILDVSKMEAGKMSIENRAFNLREEIKNLEQIYLPKAVAKNLALKFQLDENIPALISGDSVRLSQVLGNLINNAIKFTERGEVTVEIKRLKIERWKDSEAKRSSIFNLQFSILDTGIGIENEKMQKVFESFTQANSSDSRKFGGTGLGLTIAKDLVKLMGGQLEVKSDFGKGSVFSFTLPLRKTSQPDDQNVGLNLSKEEQQPQTPQVQTLHILVAEDNDYNYLVARDTVQKYFANAHLYHARNGEEVMQHLEEDDYDLVLMDIQMPRKDGYETTLEIRQTNTTLPIVGLTASVIRTDLDKCITVGMNAYVMKPFKDTELVNAICDALHLKADNTDVKGITTTKDDELFLIFIPEKLEQLRDALNENNASSIKAVLHSMRPQIVKNKLNAIAEQCSQVETATSWNDHTARMTAEIIDSVQQHINSISPIHEN
ncbi:MAG: ATP-binding protein, partial [Flavobacteriales bacterium]